MENTNMMKNKNKQIYDKKIQIKKAEKKCENPVNKMIGTKDKVCSQIGQLT